MQKIFKLFAILFLVGIGISDNAFGQDGGQLYYSGNPVMSGETSDGVNKLGLTLSFYNKDITNIYAHRYLGSPTYPVYFKKTDGFIYYIGSQSNSGHGNTKYAIAPELLTTIKYKTIAVGGTSYVVMAIKEDGTLWSWGNLSLLTAQVGNANDWEQITISDQAYYGVKTDGSLWTWGRNDYGQLGDNTTITKNIPTRIGLDIDWKNISASNNFVLATKTDGSLWSWGQNNIGQLGDNTTINKSIPTRIGLDNDWQQIATGNNYSVAIKNDGSLWSWGQNTQGQLGDGTNVNKRIPTRIGLDNDWKNVSCSYQTLAIKNNGTVWSWGYNNSGQLGNGTTINSNIPLLINSNNQNKEIFAVSGCSYFIFNEQLYIKQFQSGTNSITLNAVVEDNFGSPILERGIVYSITQNPTTSNTKIINNGQIGEFEVNISNLNPETVYFVRTFITNANGTFYSNQKSISTYSLPPTLQPSFFNAKFIYTGSTPLKSILFEFPSPASINCKGYMIITKDYKSNDISFIENGKLIYDNINHNYKSNLDQNQYTVVRDVSDINSTTASINTSNSASLNDYNCYFILVPYNINTTTFNSNTYSYNISQNKTFDFLNPRLENLSFSNLTSTSANIGFDLNDLGGQKVLETGIIINKLNNPTLENNPGGINKTDMASIKSYIFKISDLEPFTTYYAKNYAKRLLTDSLGYVSAFRNLKTNEVYTYYGEEISFTTAEQNSTNFKSFSLQGILEDENGDVVADNNYNVTFSIYLQNSGGQSVWTETQQVQTKRGVFNIILGSVNPIDLGFDTSYYLGIKLENEDEMTPRTPMVGPMYKNGGFGR